MSKLTLVFGCKLTKDFEAVIKLLDDKKVGEVVLVTSSDKAELMNDPKKMMEYAKNYNNCKFCVVGDEGYIG